MLSTPAALALIVMAAAGAIWDGKERRIPNRLVALMIAAGFSLNALAYGWEGVFRSGMGMFLGAGLLVIFYIFGGVEAGDVKFLAAVGAFVGSLNVVVIFILASIVAAVMALIAFARSRRRAGSVTIPYGIAIAGATILVAGLKVVR